VSDGHDQSDESIASTSTAQHARDRRAALRWADDEEARGTRSLGLASDEQLVVLARSGRRDATEHLLRRHRGLVESKARTFFLAGAERDDVVQEGMIGLFKAIRDFRADKMVAFRHFAETCVTRQIITATKTATRKKHRVLSTSLSLDVPGEDGSDALDTGGPRAGISTSPEHVVLGRDAAREIDTRMRQSLSPLECVALAAYVSGRSYHEIAARMAMSPKQIDNALQRAKRKMKERLARGRNPLGPD